jgi:hypothetical protein
MEVGNPILRSENGVTEVAYPIFMSENGVMEVANPILTIDTTCSWSWKSRSEIYNSKEGFGNRQPNF